MALKIKQKKNIIDKIKKLSQLSISAIIANPEYIKTNLITKLRQKSRKNNVTIYVIKNTLLKLSLKNTHFECLNKYIKGQTLIGFSIDHPGIAAKIFNNFSIKNKKFKINTAVFNNQIFLKKEIDYLSNLPTYQESIIMFILTIQNATIKKIMHILLSIKNKMTTTTKTN